MHPLAERVTSGDPRALARALRVVDDRVGDWREILRDLYPRSGDAWIVGITGNPGAGKSTLTDRLIEALRKEGKRVGVLAVDPSSPYSGGAILGDRIRMSRHFTDEGVFIRSVATRGHLGGLSRSARDMVRVLAAAGNDVVLVETVGVGQDELEITRTAHTTLVVVAPGLGDEVQAIKAGLMEVADVFTVNKADKDGADGTVRDLELMIALGTESLVAAGRVQGHAGHGHGALVKKASEERAAQGDATWTPPVLRCVATRNEGTAALLAELVRHKAWLDSTDAGRARRRARVAEEVRDSLREALIDAAVADLGADLDDAVRAVDAREIDPYGAIDALVAKFRARP